MTKKRDGDGDPRRHPPLRQRAAPSDRLVGRSGDDLRCSGYERYRRARDESD